MKSLLAAFAIGITTGAAGALLLELLALATDLRGAHWWLYLALAPAGALTGWLYRRAGANLGQGNNLVLEEIHAPRTSIPFRLAPLIMFSTVLTHLVGGSAGREGSSVQVGGAFAEKISAWFGLVTADRRRLLAVGLGAGFAAAIGAPLAGAAFGLEVLGRGGWRARALPFALVGAGSAVLVARLLHAPHLAVAPAEIDYGYGWLAPILVAAGLGFALLTRLFICVEHLFARAFAKVANPVLRPALGGTVLCAVFLFARQTRYAGLGLDVIAEALRGEVAVEDWWRKLLFTAFTLAAGFKGGEFVPLVFVGTTFGAVWATPGVPLAHLGFAAVFGAAANTPFACAVMAAELFGWRIAPAALLTGYVAYFLSGHPGIYHAQPRARLKARLAARLGLARPTC